MKNKTLRTLSVLSLFAMMMVLMGSVSAATFEKVNLNYKDVNTFDATNTRSYATVSHRVDRGYMYVNGYNLQPKTWYRLIRYSEDDGHISLGLGRSSSTGALRIRGSSYGFDTIADGNPIMLVPASQFDVSETSYHRGRMVVFDSYDPTKCLYKINPKSIKLYEKDQTTWDIIWGGGVGTFLFDDYEFLFKGRRLAANTDYSLIRFAEPWADHDMTILAESTTNANGWMKLKDSMLNGGEKVWLVLTDDIDHSVPWFSAWHGADYLFENELI